MSQQQRTVLIVDDSPEDCELYQRYLRQDREYNYNFVRAELGRLGLELWQQHQPDIVLLDYLLPDLDGIEFLTELQTITHQSFLPVIIVTGQGNEAIAVEALTLPRLNKYRLSDDTLRERSLVRKVGGFFIHRQNLL
jgi:CheY-like chemotaxis protein